MVSDRKYTYVEGVMALAHKNELNMLEAVGCSRWGNRSITSSQEALEGEFRCLTRFSDFSRKSTNVCDFFLKKKLANSILWGEFPHRSFMLSAERDFEHPFRSNPQPVRHRYSLCVWSEAEQNLRMCCLTCQSPQRRFRTQAGLVTKWEYQ